jgi:hypothetical protein
MAMARCPGCDELQKITDTGERRHASRGTDKWWRIDAHKHPLKPEMCDGSGAKV